MCILRVEGGHEPCIDCSLLPLPVREDQVQDQVQGLLFGDDNLPAEPCQAAAGFYRQHGKTCGKP